jgi:hypothetical protein
LRWLRATALAYLRRVGNLQQLAFLCSVTGYLAIAERRYRDAVPWLERDSRRHAGSRTCTRCSSSEAIT